MSSYIALDIGDKRIGVAICDAEAPFPAPLTTLAASPKLAQQIVRMIHKYKVVGVVVGYPRNQQGEETKQTERVKRIVKLLAIPKEVPIYFQDESLTSVKAESELNKRKKPFNKEDIDSLAATFILDDFVKQQLPRLKNQQQKQIATPKSKKKPKNLPGIIKKNKFKNIINKAKRQTLASKIVVSLLIVSIGFVTGSFIWYQKNIQAATAKEHYQLVTVAPGSSSTVIASSLAEKELIRSQSAFLLYTRFHAGALLQAGTYRLSGHQSVPEIVDIMAGGKVSTVDILIAPGQRVDQIIDKLVNYGYDESEITTAMERVRDHEILKGVAASAPLEGYIFPDTYKIAPDTSAEQLLRMAFDTFQSRINADSSIATGLARQGIALKDAINIASIVQMEVPDYETQQKVAQVFIKRYKESMPLGADPTFKYAAAMTNQTALPSIDSPYNTRRYSGLPPTPIANFNFTALQAVANPSDTDYVYFVSGDDGITRFSRTLEEHERLTAQYCIELCR